MLADSEKTKLIIKILKLFLQKVHCKPKTRAVVSIFFISAPPINNFQGTPGLCSCMGETKYMLIFEFPYPWGVNTQ